jgi:hypothetical protein
MSKNTKNIKKIEDGEGPFYLVLPDDLNEDGSQVVPLSPNTSRTSSSTSSRSNLIQKYPKHPSHNISSNIKQNTINTSSSKIPQISQSIPKIHLLKSVADLPKLSQQPLDETERGKLILILNCLLTNVLRYTFENRFIFILTFRFKGRKRKIKGSC